MTLGRPRKPWVDNKTERRREQWRAAKRKAKSKDVVHLDAQRCACGVVSRGLVSGVCADCRDRRGVA